MIKANELRVGNLVMFCPQGKAAVNNFRPVSVFRIYDHPSCIALDNGLPIELFYKSDSINPIPLTEEWLVKFGFLELPVKSSWWWLKGTQLGYITTDDCFECEIQTRFPPAKVQYVHQLQNLYFALTGEELKFNQ